MNIKRNRIEFVKLALLLVLIVILMTNTAVRVFEICIESDGYVEVEKHEKFTSANHFKFR